MLELIGVREGINFISVPIQLVDEDSKEWLFKMRGYTTDTQLAEEFGFDPKEEGFEVFSKQLKTRVKVVAASSPTGVALRASASPVAAPNIGASSSGAAGERRSPSPSGSEQNPTEID
jgi:hypothetical protein